MSDLGGETVRRDLPGVGCLTFENFGPGEWLTKKGEPAKKARRRYLLDEQEWDAVSSLVGTLDKPALYAWHEDHGARGAVKAERAGELVDVPEDEFVKRIRLLGLGASAMRDEGAERGNIIHATFHSLTVDGTPPNPADFPALARPWLQGAIGAWLAMNPLEPFTSEEIVCHPELEYAGRPDLIARARTPDDPVHKLTLIDYKTGKGRVFDQAHYQTRLYEMALRALGVHVERILIVGIDDDGGFQLIECECGEDDAIALLDTFRARKRINAGMAAQRKAAKRRAAA